MEPIELRRYLRVITLLWFALLILGSIQSARPSAISPFHSEIHWIAFGVGTGLLLLVSRRRLQQALSALAVLVLAVSIEFLQHLIYRSAIEWRDVRDDALAILATILLYALLSDIRKGLKPSDDPA